jgi:four helix bundle protein
VDLISSEQSEDFICAADFILAKARISLYNALEVSTMAENKLADLSTEFAVKILKLTDGMKGHYSLVNQLERSATSIGANIREAKYAHSKPDFVSKLQIALKECYETEYWLTLFVRSGLADRTTVKPLYDQCGTLRCLLVASINTAKKNLEKKNAL